VVLAELEFQRARTYDVPMCDEDIEAVDDIYERYGLVLLPLLQSLGAVEDDYEVVAAALVVDLGDLAVSTHVDCRMR
jgi:hypothetical protein